MPRARLLAAIVAALAAVSERTAAGADREDGTAAGFPMDVVGACPDAADVRRLLAVLMSGEQAAAAPVSIQDRGARFRIAVGDHSTMLDDPARDCGKRARQAAVVVAAELQPRSIVLGPPEWTIEKGLVF